MNQFDKTFPLVKDKIRKQAKSPGGGKPRHYISSGRLLTSSAFTLLMCCLLVIFSGCASLLYGVTSGDSHPTPIIKLKPAPSSSPSTPAPLTDSERAQSIVQGMSLDQELGRLGIVEV